MHKATLEHNKDLANLYRYTDILIYMCAPVTDILDTPL